MLSKVENERAIRLLEGFLIVIEPDGHTGGTLSLTVNGEVHLLKAGDPFYFPSHLPNRLPESCKARMWAVWIPTF